MNRTEAIRAAQKLAEHPAKDWIGNRFDGRTWFRACMRCGVQETMEMPAGVKSATDVPPNFDEKMFAWMLKFSDTHASCPPI